MAARGDRPHRPGRPDDLPDAPDRPIGRWISGQSIDRPGDDLPGPVLYRGGGRYELLDGQGKLDPQVVDDLSPEGVTYSAYRDEAEAAVDNGEAEGAFLLRPTRIDDVWEVARGGGVMPQKSTFFYPKLTSGLLLFPV